MKPVIPIRLAALSTTLLLTMSQATSADAQSASTPYPPACFTQVPEVLDPSEPNVALIWSGLLTLEPAGTNSVWVSPRFRQMNADIYRVGCAEPDRSVILVEFRLRDSWPVGYYSAMFLPEFRGVTGLGPVSFELKPEANAHGQSLQQHLLTRTVIGDFTDGWDDSRQYRWRYVLDLSPLGADWGDAAVWYNESLSLEIDTGEGAAPLAIAIPATGDVLQANPSLPLNGRLSGTWIEAGTADQGFLLTIGQSVPAAGTAIERPENTELHVFLSWFTFDAQGEPLWLVGDTRFVQGADSVSLALWQLSAAEFMGGWLETGLGHDPFVLAGALRVDARNCNNLEVSYELEAMGLGAGEMKLERLLAQETAGYPCRDRLARSESLAPPSAK